MTRIRARLIALVLLSVLPALALVLYVFARQGWAAAEAGLPSPSARTGLPLAPEAGIGTVSGQSAPALAETTYDYLSGSRGNEASGEREVAAPEVSVATSDGLATWAAIVLVLVAMLAVGWLYSDVKLLRRLNNLLNAARRLGAGDLSVRGLLSGEKGELAELGTTLDQLADALRTRKSEVEQAQVARRESEIKYRALLEQMPAVTYVTRFDEALSTPYLSPQIEAMLGFTPSEWVGDPTLWTSRLHPADRDLVVAAQRHSVTAGEPFRMEYRYLARDGRTVWVRDETVVVRDEAGRPLFLQGLMFDISEHKLLEQQLLQAQRMESVGRLAAGVAHDLNNILTAIGAYADFAKSPLAPDDQTRTEIDELLKATDRATNLTRQLLAFSRRQALELKTIGLNELAQELAKMLRRLIREDVELLIKPGQDLWPVMADQSQIEQVLVNLVVNARDAMPGGGRIAILTANVTLDERSAKGRLETAPGDYAVLVVTDTGSGMGEETLEHLFEPFFTTKSTGEGTGLGLATVYGIVKQHGGDIRVSSQLGVGSTFEIFLRRADRHAEEPEWVGQLSELPGGRETILLAEDEQTVREVTQRLLGRLGYSVLAASNGQEALRLAEVNDSRIALLLTDLVMPVMGGSELARHLLAAKPAPRVLFMSAYRDAKVLPDDLMSAGAGFLEKPFTSELLAHKVRQALDERPRAVAEFAG